MKFKLTSCILSTDFSSQEDVGSVIEPSPLFPLGDMLYHSRAGSAEPADEEAKKAFADYEKQFASPPAPKEAEKFRPLTQAETKKLTKERDDAKAGLEKAKADLVAAGKDLSAAKAATAAVEGKLKQAKVELDGLQKGLDSHVQENATLKQTIVDLRKEIKSLSDELTSALLGDTKGAKGDKK